MKAERLDGSYHDLPRCEARIVRETMKFRVSVGASSPLCGRYARYRIDGRPRCHWHASREALEFQMHGAMFDFVRHLQRQRTWSERTFGPGQRTQGVIDHIKKELREIEADPADIGEWIDVVALALDGAWRAGYSPEEIIAALAAKQARNEARKWPDWRTQPHDRAIEHVREPEMREEQ
jgi:Protein of unknown function (DUF550)